jgi:excisionase family DNA binding protein
MDPLLVSRRDAAIALGISLRSIDYLLARGELPARQIGRRKMIARAALERFAASSTAKKTVDNNGQ